MSTSNLITEIEEVKAIETERQSAEEDEQVRLESAVIKIQCHFKGHLWRNRFKVKMRAHLRKLKMKQFPYDFNEGNFIIHDFSKLSSRRRYWASEDRFSGSDTTEASGNMSEPHQNNSDGNMSDSITDGISFSASKFKLKADQYDPQRDSEESKRGRTKQKVYVRFAQRPRNYSVDSSCSEESDCDDPVREMVKSKILNLYEDNSQQLYNNAVQFKELKDAQKNGYDYYGFNQQKAAHEQQMLNPNFHPHQMMSMLAQMWQPQQFRHQEEGPKNFENLQQKPFW